MGEGEGVQGEALGEAREAIREAQSYYEASVVIREATGATVKH
jgi:hypothetical protein